MTEQRRHRPAILSWLAAMCLAAAPGCKNKEDAPSEDNSGDSSDKGGGSPFSGMGPFAKIFASGLTEPGPYEEPKKSPDFDEDEPHLLVMELNKPIAELETMSMFGTMTGKPLRKLQNALREAAQNDKVEGIVLRANGFSTSMAMAQELRASLEEFKAAGKSLHCHTEDVANAGYYVLTACEQIGLSPLGDVMITGAAATPIHVKGLLDRVGVTADFLHVGDYKGAAEPVTREEPSPEMIETLEGLLDESYATLVEGLVDGRGLSEEEAKTAVDTAMFVANEAKDAKLVDEVTTWESFLAATGKPWTKGKGMENPLEDMSALQRFIGLLPPDRPSEPHVALVYAVGNVIDGEGTGIVGARQEIASRTLVATLRALAKDDNVKAIVMRVSSPGGSARASELIWHAVDEAKKSKPVVVSMGEVAASGGYYISAGASKIFAQENTLTGSIGVVGGKLVFGDALASVGVESFEVQRGKRALMWSSMEPWNEEERAAVQKMMELTYDEFVGRVMAGRSMERDAVHAIAQGRVWTGAAAKENGLVDEIGGLDAALAEAHELAGLPVSTELEVYPGEPTLRDLLSSFGAVQARTSVTSTAAMTSALQDVELLAGPEIAGHARSILETLFALRDAKVLALSWIRPL